MSVASIALTESREAAMSLPRPTLLELVQRRLRESPYYYLRTIQCACDDGAVTLRGRAPSFYLKQTVQAVVEKVEGVQQVINLVDVAYPAAGD